MQFVSVTVAPRGTLDLKLFSVTSLLTPLPVADWVLARAPLPKSKRPANSPINTFIAINSTHLLLASKQRAEENFKFDQYHIQAKGLIQPTGIGIGSLTSHSYWCFDRSPSSGAALPFCADQKPKANKLQLQKIINNKWPACWIPNPWDMSYWLWFSTANIP